MIHYCNHHFNAHCWHMWRSCWIFYKLCYLLIISYSILLPNEWIMSKILIVVSTYSREQLYEVNQNNPSVASNARENIDCMLIQGSFNFLFVTALGLPHHLLSVWLSESQLVFFFQSWCSLHFDYVKLPHSVSLRPLFWLAGCHVSISVASFSVQSNPFRCSSIKTYRTVN